MLTVKRLLPAGCLVGLTLLGACVDNVPPADGQPPTLAAAQAAGGAAAHARPRKTPVPLPGGGIRLDLGGEGRHVRALERQHDGTYKTICIDAPDALRPRDDPGLGGAPGGSP
jgi:hypothetical protein